MSCSSNNSQKEKISPYNIHIERTLLKPTMMIMVRGQIEFMHRSIQLRFS